MENFGKNEQNPQDNLILKFRQKLLKCTKPTKKSMSSNRIHTFLMPTTRREFHAFSDRCSMCRKSFHGCAFPPTYLR